MVGCGCVGVDGGLCVCMLCVVRVRRLCVVCNAYGAHSVCCVVGVCVCGVMRGAWFRLAVVGLLGLCCPVGGWLVRGWCAVVVWLLFGC